MNQQECLAAQRRKKVKRPDFLAAPGRQRRPVLQKERHVRPQRRGQFVQFHGRQRLVKQLIQRDQRCRGVATAATKTGRQRDFFLQTDGHPFIDPCRLQKRGGRAVDKILRIRGQVRVRARKLNSGAAPPKGQ